MQNACSAPHPLERFKKCSSLYDDERYRLSGKPSKRGPDQKCNKSQNADQCWNKPSAVFHGQHEAIGIVRVVEEPRGGRKAGIRGLASDILLNSNCENKSCLLIENMVATAVFTKKTPVPVRASLSRAINIVNCVRGRFIRAG